MPRNPPWVADELLVVLAVYLAERRVLEETHPRVVEASRLLNSLPIHAEAGRSGFRTPDAIVLRLANYRSLDPTTSSRGMTNGGRAAKEVWDRFAGEPTVVTDLVESIASSVQGPSPGPVSDESGEEVIPEGRLIYRMHRRRERSAELRKRKLAAIRATGERPRCHICGLDPESVFGSTLASTCWSAITSPRFRLVNARRSSATWSFSAQTAIAQSTGSV